MEIILVIAWIVVAATLASSILWSLLHSLWFKPLRLKRAFLAQGIPGMPYRFFYGNLLDIVALDDSARKSPMPLLSHNIAPRILSNYFFWSQTLGTPFFFWFGPQARVYVTEPEQGRDILSNKFGHYGKPRVRPDTNDLIGKGLVALQGEKWAQHRRIVSPAFFMEKLKAMTPTIAACANSTVDNWAANIEKEASGRKEIDVHQEFRNLAADIIGHTAFGSSYAEGKRVFEIQHEQQVILNNVLRNMYIPGSRYLPTSVNRYRWQLQREIQKLLRQMIYSRMEGADGGRSSLYGNDLLGLMMAANRSELQGSQKNLSMGIDEIVDECKTFFFAGHETTSTLLTWACMLLGENQEWQEKARAEVLAVCGNEPPTADSLNNLRILGMVLNETLRLYPPVTTLTREASTKDMCLSKDLVLPRGSAAVVPIIVFHHDPKYWGPDATEFNPQRFADGIAKASTNPSAFMPFGLGPRNCVGQTFAILEAKVVLSIILQRFTFHLSSAYVHAPTLVLTLQPQYGMQIIFEKFDA